ncbi:MAG: rod shape-determining protein RodA [Opitutales bacterium]
MTLLRRFVALQVFLLAFLWRVLMDHRIEIAELASESRIKAKSLSAERPFDWVNPMAIVILGLMSTSFIHSAQASSQGGYWKMQIIWFCLGIIAYFVVSFTDYRLLLRYAHYLYGAGIFGLLLVFFGPEVYGSRRWIDFGVFKVQPTELAKIGALVLSASILARSKVGPGSDSSNTIAIAKVSGCFLLPMFLIFLQPDLGSAIVFPPMVFSLLYVAKVPAKYFLRALIALLAFLAVIGVDVYGYYQYQYNQGASSDDQGSYEDHSLIPLKDYQRKRILTFLAPEVTDPRGVGSNWNRNQALIAVGSGGLTGKGYGKGLQAGLGYLPQAVAHNDFIFAVIAEESGFVGGAFALILYAVILWNSLRIASMAQDRFGTLLAVGVAVLLMVHIFINVGMTVGITPITGLPLPFLSYGGSFLLSCCILMGLVQSVHRFRKDFA